MMLKIAIVGPEESKWNNLEVSKANVQMKVNYIFNNHQFNFSLTEDMPDNEIMLISGGCPKGGVDIWAEEVANMMGIPKIIYKPEVNRWEDEVGNLDTIGVCPLDHTKIDLTNHNCNRLIGYKSRNIKIAKECDILYCIVPYRLYEYCTHHSPFNLTHPKNGGCWTMEQARKFGKEVYLVEIK